MKPCLGCQSPIRCAHQRKCVEGIVSFDLKFGERRTLPNRRPAESREITFARSDGAEVTYEATIGFYPQDNDPGEIFLFGPKDGTDMAAICADGSVLISIALQYGAPPEVLAEAIGRTPVELDGPSIRPVSILGAALDAILEAKRERGSENAA